jgi:NAD(P)-dependent dehydrogenase (short-subunit alcohol dehydrogenase family)
LSNPDGWDWRQEIAVVTGGSGGIGAKITERLVKLGVRVAVLDVTDLPAALQKNPLIRFYQCDITSFESVAKAAEAVRADFGHPSILINNAGIANHDPLPILNDTEGFLKKVFAVNCVGLWATTKEFLPHMVEENKGHVVTLSSIAAFTTFPAGVGYSASKAAALSFHEGLTCELKHLYKAPNVMTTVFHPNFVRTPLLGRMIEGLEKAGVRLMEPDTVAEAIVGQIVSKRGGQVFVPGASSMVAGIRGWSTWLQEIVRDASGRVAAKGHN